MPWDEDEAARDRMNPRSRAGLRRIGAATRRQRQRLHLSQGDVERMTGIDQTTLSRFERGERVGIRFTRFALLVETLGGLDFGSYRPGANADELRLGPRGLYPRADVAREQLREAEAAIARLWKVVEAMETPAATELEDTA
jgi:transcriptional regulator with XRE-family HTH domain